jgi:hypothetical protein
VSRSVTIVALLAAVAFAQQAVPMDLHDLANTDGNWQEGVAVIPASRAQVLQWLTDYPSWARRFPDIEWAEVLADDDRGRHVVRFRSKIADATITVHETVSPSLLVFEGWMSFAHTQGRIHLIDLGNGTTRVLMQSTSEAHGIARLFATRRFKRDRAFRVTHSHLSALWDLANGNDPGVRYSRH